MRISRCGLPLLIRNFCYEWGGGTYDRECFISNNRTSLFWFSCWNNHCICLDFASSEIEQQINKIKKHICTWRFNVFFLHIKSANHILWFLHFLFLFYYEFKIKSIAYNVPSAFFFSIICLSNIIASASSLPEELNLV